MIKYCDVLRPFDRASVLENRGIKHAPLEGQKQFVLRKFRLGEPIPEGSRLIRHEQEWCAGDTWSTGGKPAGPYDVYLYEVPLHG